MDMDNDRVLAQCESEWLDPDFHYGPYSPYYGEDEDDAPEEGEMMLYILADVSLYYVELKVEKFDDENGKKFGVCLDIMESNNPEQGAYDLRCEVGAEKPENIDTYCKALESYLDENGIDLADYEYKKG